MKTLLHHYYYESGNHPGYLAMVAKIKANSEGRGHWLNAIPMNNKGRGDLAGPNPEEVELETSYVFGNQWNEADSNGNKGRRLFDWYEEYNTGNRDLKIGHWLEITPEMAEARRSTCVCGYCGKHYGPNHGPVPVDGFCGACLDSPYLETKDLHLLRLRHVIEDGGAAFTNRPELTEAELAELMPKYVERQTIGKDSRAVAKRAKERADAIAKCDGKTAAAYAERDGMLWLCDNNISLDNVIYYSHADKFSFGWRTPVSPEVRSRLLDLLTEAPFEYEIK